MMLTADDQPNIPATTQNISLVGAVRFVLRDFLGSLRITCSLFALSILLIFFGTLAQKTLGMWTVVDRYFWSFYVMVEVQPLLEFGKIFLGLDPATQSKASFPFPGGKLLGGLLVMNLIAAYTWRILELPGIALKTAARGTTGRQKFWDVSLLLTRRLALFTLHGGVLLLFVGEYITREFQVEQQMQIREGASADFAVDTRNYELAFIRPIDSTTSRVTVVPGRQLRAAGTANNRIAHGELPVDIEVIEYMVNSSITVSGPDNRATAGFGRGEMAVDQPEVSGVDVTKKMDVPSVYVRFFKPGTDEQLGTYLVSLYFDRPQVLTVDGVDYGIQFRHERHYKPFQMHLIDFRFDRYIGTSTAKNYSSEVRLVDPERGQDRTITIRMNEPFYHRGETYYQSSFSPDEMGTVLQVVRNPGWVLPYVACSLVTLGMLGYFGFYIVIFLRRMFAGQARSMIGNIKASIRDSRTLPKRLVELLAVPVVTVVLAGLLVLMAVMPPTAKNRMDLGRAGRLPVVDGGRVKPLDTIARVNLRQITHSEQFEDESGQKQSAMKWFLDAASGTPTEPGIAAEYKIFRIEHDQLRDLLKLKPRTGLRYSVNEVRDQFREFDEAARKALLRKEAGKDLDLFETKTLELRKHLETYIEVWQGHAPLLLPPRDGREWRAPYTAYQNAIEAARPNIARRVSEQGIEFDPSRMTAEEQQRFYELVRPIIAEEVAKDTAASAWQSALAAYREKDADRFNKAVNELHGIAEKSIPANDLARVRFETFLNESGLFYHCTLMYALAAFGCLAGWIALLFSVPVGNSIRRGTFWLLVVTFLVHTFTLLSRMYLMDRPLVFVTNLYSSAVFIGWVAVAVCLIVELLYPISVGNLVAGSLGFTTSIIAHNLAVSGDTLEMMQAVLDDNFWLASHVTTVTMGYSATYIAAAVAMVYIATAALQPKFLLKRPIKLGSSKSMELGRAIGQILYGTVCFATLLSFVGTVLGGIWADFSWGRFWGWDPKENGAVLIVLWNALILHARWAGLVKDRGVAVLAVVGAMITTWSWFGTNQLGVGLHAYGFSNKLATGCTITWVLLVIPIIVGLVPWKLIWNDSTASKAK